MRSLSAILLFATACGSDLTTLEVTCGTDQGEIPVPTSIMPRVAKVDPSRRSVSPDTQKVSTDVPKTMHPLCFSPVPELDGLVRASVQRFVERLEIPVVTCERGVQVTVQKDLVVRGKWVSGWATYYRACTFDECNREAIIVLDESILTFKSEWAEEIIDHEIGHILSAWGTIAKVNMHLPVDYHVMSPTLHRDTQWTQEDIDLWCSASPCGRTELDGDWIYPVLPLPGTVADAGTSYLSGTAIDAGGYDGGLSSDAN